MKAEDNSPTMKRGGSMITSFCVDAILELGQERWIEPNAWQSLEKTVKDSKIK